MGIPKADNSLLCLSPRPPPQSFLPAAPDARGAVPASPRPNVPAPLPFTPTAAARNPFATEVETLKARVRQLEEEVCGCVLCAGLWFRV